MIRNHHYFFLISLVFVMSMIWGNAHAQTPVPNSNPNTSSSGTSLNPNSAPPGIGPQSTSNGSGTCDFTELKNSLIGTESSGVGGSGVCGGYTAVNKECCAKDPKCPHKPGTCTSGKYQFMPATAAELESYKNGPENCKKMCISGVGFASAECASVQESVMDEFTLKNLHDLKKTCPAAQAAVDNGTQINSKEYGTCTATWSGILASAHLAGMNGTCAALGSGLNYDPSDGASTASDYLCAHDGLPVPEVDCNPAPYQTSSGGLAQASNTWGDTPPPPARTSAFPGGNMNSLTQALKYIWVAAFQLMTEQITAVMMQQVQGIGMLLDAKHQLETQRLFQEKTAEAHKDYHPSEQMCEIGTFVRNLAETDGRAKLTTAALAKNVLERELSSGDSPTLEGELSDLRSRIITYQEEFCRQEDDGRGTEDLCQSPADDIMQNRDINYTESIDAPLTLNVDFLDEDVTDEERSIFSLMNYLFMHRPFAELSEPLTTLNRSIEPYQDLRSIVAMRGVARNSMAHIIAEKTAGPTHENNAAPFMMALMEELGLEEDEIVEILGENPSYYAQMEILTKKIYQDPNFYVNLYDKPANVKRIRTAMRAIKLMQDRDIHNALLRREMLLSILLELRARDAQDDVTDNIGDQIARN